MMPAHVIQELFAHNYKQRIAQPTVVGQHFLELAPVFAWYIAEVVGIKPPDMVSAQCVIPTFASENTVQ